MAYTYVRDRNLEVAPEDESREMALKRHLICMDPKECSWIDFEGLVTDRKNYQANLNDEYRGRLAAIWIEQYFDAEIKKLETQVPKNDALIKAYKEKIELYGHMFELMTNAATKEEFSLYAERFLKLLTREVSEIYLNQEKHATPQENELQFHRLKRLLFATGSYCKMRDPNLKTIEQIYDEFNKQSAKIFVSAVASPVAVVSAPLSAALTAVDKAISAHDAVSSMIAGDNNASIPQRIKANFSAGWNWIKAQAKSAWVWAKKNPGKAIVGGVLGVGAIVAAAIFAPIAIPVIGGVAGIGKVVSLGLESKKLKEESAARMVEFEKLIEHIADPNDAIKKVKALPPESTVMSEYDMDLANQEVMNIRSMGLVDHHVFDRLKETPEHHRKKSKVSSEPVHSSEVSNKSSGVPAFNPHEFVKTSSREQHNPAEAKEAALKLANEARKLVESHVELKGAPKSPIASELKSDERPRFKMGGG